MGTRTTFWNLYQPADSEVFDQQLNDNTDYALIDSGAATLNATLQTHISAASPHAGHATYLANTFTGTQTTRVSADALSFLSDIPALVAPGTSVGAHIGYRAHAYDAADHYREFFWRVRTNTNAGAGQLDLFTDVDGNAASLLATFGSDLSSTFFGPVRTSETAAISDALSANVIGDAQQRLIVRADGRITWGSGALAGDVTLYRAAAGILQTEQELRQRGNANTDEAFAAYVNGDAFERFYVHSDGYMAWGSGAAGADATLQRSGPAAMRLTGALEVTGNLTSGGIQYSLVGHTHQTLSTQLTNSTGVDLVAGDVVVLNSATDQSVVIGGDDSQEGAVVALAAIPNGTLGAFGTIGRVVPVKVLAGVVRGNWLAPSATARQAKGTLTKTVGTFARALNNRQPDGTVDAIILGGGGGGGAQNLLTYDVQNTSGNAYVLPFTPATNGVVLVAVNGQAQLQGRDWTIAGSTITFTTALANDDLHVIYLTAQAFNASNNFIHDERTPAIGDTTINLSASPTSTPLVTRGGVPQYQTKGHYTIVGNIMTFAEPFSATEDRTVSADYFVAGGGAGDAASVSGIQAVPAVGAAANKLVATDATGHLPASIMPTTYTFHEEFLPANGTTTVALSQTPGVVLMVFRDGVAQSVADGHYTIAANVLTFADAFDGSSRVLVSYIAGIAIGAATTLQGFTASAAAAPQVGTLVATDPASGLLPSSILPALARTNQLTNGGFERWQRGNGPFTTTSAVWADRWFLSLVGSDTMSISKSTTTVAPGSNSSAACTFTLGTGAGQSNISQQLKGVSPPFGSADGYEFAGRQLSLSFALYTGVANAVRIALYDRSNAVWTYSAYHPGDNAWRNLTISYAAPANCQELDVYVMFAASCTAYLDNAMLVFGVNAADYIPIPPADDLARCLRYYELLDLAGSGNARVTGYMPASGAWDWDFPFKAMKAVSPTATVVGTWGSQNVSSGPTVMGPTPYLVFMRMIATALGFAEVYNTTAGNNMTFEANP